MQSTASLLLGVLALLVQPSSALVARAPVRIGAPAHGSAPLVALRRPTLVFMQAEAEEPAADAAEEAPAAAAVAAEPITKEAPAPPKDEGFDISQYVGPCAALLTRPATAPPESEELRPLWTLSPSLSLRLAAPWPRARCVWSPRW